MADPSRLRIGSSVGNLPEVVSWVETFCKAHPSASAFEQKLQLVVEELLMNTIMHGSGKDGDTASIWLSLYPQPEGVALIIEDDGTPFDPLTYEVLPDTNAPLDDRPIGGLGVMLVREMTDGASYSHCHGLNRIALVFGPGPLPKAPQDDGDTGTETRPPIRPRGLTLRILAILLFIPAAGLVAAGALNYLKFDRILTEAAAARYDPVLRELARAISDSLGEGLTLASTKTTENLIQRSSTQFEGAFDLIVRDVNGLELFSTFEESGGENVGTFTQPPPPDEIHHDFSVSDRFVGQISVMQHGEPVGVLSLSHDATKARTAMPDLVRQIRRAGVIAMIPALPLLILATLIMLGRIEGRMHRRKLAVERAARLNSPDPGTSDTLVQAIWRISSWPTKASNGST